MRIPIVLGLVLLVANVGHAGEKRRAPRAYRPATLQALAKSQQWAAEHPETATFKAKEAHLYKGPAAGKAAAMRTAAEDAWRYALQPHPTDQERFVIDSYDDNVYIHYDTNRLPGEIRTVRFGELPWLGALGFHNAEAAERQTSYHHSSGTVMSVAEYRAAVAKAGLRMQASGVGSTWLVLPNPFAKLSPGEIQNHRALVAKYNAHLTGYQSNPEAPLMRALMRELYDLESEYDHGVGHLQEWNISETGLLYTDADLPQVGFKYQKANWRRPEFE